MASVHRRPESPYWHAAFRGADGKLVLRSTKQTDRASALAAALEFERAAKLAKRGELTEAQTRDILADILKRAATGETLRTESIGDFFRAWFASKKARKSAGTALRYENVVDSFLESLRERKAKPITSLVARDVQRFLDGRMAKGLAPQTVALNIKVIRTALNAARRQGLITTNPAEAVELPEGDSVERGTFSAPEVKMLVDTAEREWKTLILLAYFTGARLSDCCNLEWEDVDLSAGTLTYKQSKTGLKVLVPLHPDLLAHLEGLAGTDKPERWIMPHMAGLKPGGRHGLSESFKLIMRKAGISGQIVEGAGVRNISRRSFHALRHSFTSALANAGVAPELRMKLTGHTTEAIHRGYTHHEIKTLADAVQKIPSLTSQ